MIKKSLNLAAALLILSITLDAIVFIFKCSRALGDYLSELNEDRKKKRLEEKEQAK